MLKNKIIIKKIRNIFIFLMAILIMVGIYKNVRDSRAENVIQVEVEVADKSELIEKQTITVDATETKDGDYFLDLPTSVNENIVAKYYTADGTEVEMNDENSDKTLKLTEAEVTEKKIQLEIDYDKKDVTTEDNQVVTLYNKELKPQQADENEKTEQQAEQQLAEDEVTVTGYMPLDAKTEIKEIDLATLTQVKLPSENQTMRKAYEVSVYQEVEKQKETQTETTDNTSVDNLNTTAENAETNSEKIDKEESNSTDNIETEKVEYDPSKYGEKINIKTKNTEENTNPVIYNLTENNDAEVAGDSNIEDEGKTITVVEEKNDKTIRYILATEPKPEEVTADEDMSADDENAVADSDVNYDNEIALTASVNMLKTTSNETLVGSGFLGNTSIQRQNIENVTFLNSTSGANSTKWDVSAAGNSSILAWYVTNNSNGALKVYIGSSGTIYANTNSSYLFANIGWSDKCTATETITNLNLLNTSKVTDMSNMFTGTGYRSMTSLKLGENFDTSNVTNMSEMFSGTGYKSMTSLNLGKNFDTSNVIDMSWMFLNTGNDKMTTLELGDKFDTSKVGSMIEMFLRVGKESLETLNLGKAFKNFPTDSGNNAGVLGDYYEDVFKGVKLYVADEIYNNTTSVKLNPTSNQTMSWHRGNVYKLSEKNCLRTTNTEQNLTSGFLGNTSIQRQNIENVTFVDGDKSARKAKNSYDATNNTGNGHSSSATTWKDLSGSTNGTVNGPTWGSDYLKFDGTNDWVNLGQMSFANNTVTLDATVSFDGFSTTSNVGEINIIGNQNGGGIGLMLKDQKPSIAVHIKEQNTWYFATSNTVVTTGTKYHITGTYNGKDLCLYVNGSLVAKTTQAGTISTPTNNTVMAIGCNPNGSSSSDGAFLTGKIYSLSIYDNVEWDVSEAGDNSIIAWNVRSNSNGAQKVYIASDGDIYANKDSSYLFANLGYAEICTATETYTNLSLLNTNNVTNMKGMFQDSGYRSMTKLDLGNNFYTSKVTDMSHMFRGTGYKSMASFSLGSNFDTSKVTDMTWMFVSIGNNSKLASLDLGDKFDTSNVTNMNGMFYYAGYASLESVNLGNKFNTSNVTDMADMFREFGHEKLTQLNLGDKFDTSKVTTMAEMFRGTGYQKITSLSLGYKFSTKNVTSMDNIFFCTGYVSMTTLDLGPAFTKFAGTNTDMFGGAGASETVKIYVPSAIYKDSKNFKQSSSSSTAIAYTRGTVVLKYKPTWKLISSVPDTTNKKLAVTVGAMGYDIISDKPYPSTTTATLSSYSIEEGDDGSGGRKPTQTRTVSASSTWTESVGTETATGVKYTITFSNWEQSTFDEKWLYKNTSGNFSINITSIATDNYTNKSDSNEYLGTTRVNKNTTGSLFADFVAPAVKYSSVDLEMDTVSKSVALTFYITDSFYDTTTSRDLTIDDLTIKIGGKVPDWTKVSKSLKVAETMHSAYYDQRALGKSYTVTISNLEQLNIADGDKYLDYSGIITIGIPAGVAKDYSGNANIATTITTGVSIPKGDYEDAAAIDVVAPKIIKTDSTIDLNAKTASVTIQATDKYFLSSTLTSNIDVYVGATKSTSIGKSIASTKNLTETRTENGVTSTVQYGQEVTVKLTNLPTDANQIKLLIPKGVVMDNTGNVNKTTDIMVINTLKSDGGSWRSSGFLGNNNIQKQNIENVTFLKENIGITRPRNGYNDQNGTGNGGSSFMSSTLKDLFGNNDGKLNGASSPLTESCIQFDGKDDWVNLGQMSFSNNTVTLDVTIATDEITSGEVYLLGNVESGGVGIALEDGKPKGVVYSKELGYYLTIISPTAVTVGEETHIVMKYDGKCQYLYVNGKLVGTVEKAGTIGTPNDNTVMAMGCNPYKDTATSGFFKGKIYSAYIYDEALSEKEITRSEEMWDVSVQRDRSIMAWSEKSNSNGALKVYIASEGDIFANKDMSYFFAYIGYADICTATETITNINLLNTSRVTNMENMFQETGYTAMTSLDLGSNFDTSNVTDMSNMFNSTGYTAMTSLDLGDKFDTSNVKYMTYMFDRTGYTAMTSLNLGDKFNTSNVTDMSNMFDSTGYTAMTSLDLGDKFDTSNVTNMYEMFDSTGYTAMTSLDLGDKFDTRNVTDMEYMFDSTGYTAMTSLDLGPAFTNIPDGDIKSGSKTQKAYHHMFSYTGKSGAVVIQAPESIFQDKNNFKLNSSATTGTINFTRGTITPKYRVEWVNDGATVNTTNKSIAIKLRAMTNPEAGANEYISDITGSLSTGNIKISIDGTDITSIVTKSLGTVTQPTNSKTGAKDLEQTLTISNLEEASRRTGKSYLEWSGNIKIEIIQKTTSDKYGNKNVGVSSEGTRTDSIIVTTAVDQNTSGSLFVDTIKPEFTYVYSSGNIDKTNKTLTVEFSATDKFFSASTILGNEANITVKLLDTDTQIPNANITKTLTKTSDITETRDGTSVKIGEKYKLVIGGLEETNIATGAKYRDYSGPMSITIPANLVSDKSGNKNVSKTITIGVNDPGGSSSSKVTVDVVDPLWKTQNINIDKTNKKVTVDLVGTDKYYKSNSLTIDKITVYVDGEEASTITKSLSGATSLTETRTVDGTSSTVQYGVKYTLTLSNWQESSKQTGKDFLEWSGTTKIKIAAGTLTDNSSNTSKEATFELGHVDFIKPEIVKVSSTVDKTAKTETIIFNLYDKYLFKDTYIDKYFIYANNISVYIDGESATGLTKTFTKVSDIAVTGKGVIGQQYKLVLSNFEQSTIASGKKYKDYSGTVSIEIAAGVVKDTSGNTNDKIKITGDFVDFIAPAVIYRNTDLEKDSVYKSVSMIFEVTDKYYSSENKDLQLSDLTIKIDNKIIDNSSNVTRNLRVVNLKDTIDGSERIIGKCYWLTLSGLEQLQIKEGDKYLDYSGVITVAIPASKAKDDSSNQNTATTITTGIDLPEGTGTAEVVDVVAPHIEVTSLTVDAKAKTGTVTIQATDKYFANSTLSTSIDVYVNGTKSTSVGKTITSKNLTETRSENGTTSTVQYGQEVTLTLTNIPSDSTIKQVKLLIPEGAVLDKSGNKNKETSIMLINKLKATNTETYATAGFLGNTNIARERIETVTFVDNLDNVNSTAKDVSAQGDGSILSWYDEKTAMGGYQQYDVYIGSDYEIFANSDSSYLFACLGSNDRIDYTKKETIVNIDLLNTVTATNMDDMFYETGTMAMEKLDLGSKFDTSNVTSMNGMFYDTGNNSMTDLNLGSNFDTSNVTSMRLMFERTGYTAMTSLKLGSKFDTSKVTDMSSMFFGTGHTAMTSLNLGDKFNTSNVTTMDKMFWDTGYEAMTSLNLGDKFNTSNVTDMDMMFMGTGHNAMESLNLGTNFDTSKVTNMRSMFQATGNKMTSLDLGDKFYTSKVTDMSSMFFGTGDTAMTSLDLGPAFTNIASTNGNMFTLVGKSGSLVVYAPESIYNNKTNFKLNTSSSTTVALSTGTINAKYRIEWQKEAATVNTTNKSIAITLRATTNPEVDASEYTSDVTGSLAVGNIKVLIDGTDITSIVTKSLGTATQVDNTRTGAKDVTYTLTLSKLEEASRRTGKNYKEWSGNITIQVSQGTAIDKYGNKNTAIASDGVRASHTITTTAVDKNTSGSMFVDTIQPEFTYVYSSGNIDKTNKTLTVEFSVTDKYFSTSTILNNAANITVKLLDTNTQIPNANITKTLTKVSDVTETRSGSTTAVKIGEKYKLVIGGLEETNIATGAKYRDYSGPMSITIPANLASDKSGNKNVAKTITIGVNEPGGSSSNQQIVDVADPMWQAQNINIDKANKRVTVDLVGTDKYYKSNSLTTDKITVYVDGEEASTITKNLSQATSLTETRTINGTSSTVQYGVKYTLTLSGWQEDSKQTAKGKSFLEWSGTTKIKISAGTITDQYTNTSKEKEFTLGHADFIKPEIVKVSSSADKTAQTETIVFNVVDKYLDSTKTLSADNILVYVDREATTGITKTLTKVSDLTATVNGSSKVVGQQYKLVLSSFKKTRTKLDSTRNYTDWSGTVSIDVKAGAVSDTSSNTNDLTTVAGDFVDYIKPEITYNYAEGDIDYTNKTFTMKIDAVDKYFSESAVLTTANLKNYLTIKIDGVDITNNADVTKEIIATENITAGTTAKPINKTINGTVQTGLTNQVVGKRYTLKLSNLEQVIKTGNYLDYSGVVTVAIKDNPVFVKDTSSNTNVATTITSGLTFPGTSGTEKVVDVVDPLWEQLGSATAEPKKQTASIVLKGTDKYLNKANSNLTTDKIKVVVNGVEQKSGITVKVTEDTSVTMTYGKQYNVYVSGFVSNAYQVKIVLLSGSLVDNSGNKNKEQEFVLYSCLKKTNTETSATSPFLGNSKIQRQKIEKIIFEDEANYTNSTRWDVSAQEDGSIIAWYETTSRGTYIVHIGSSIIMNGNIDSSYLFANIGRDTACAETSEASNPIIENIGLLHVDNVTNMSHMFEDFGYSKMKTFSLGDGFDTSSVTDMSNMFNEAGYTAMTTITFGSKFTTKNVTNMSRMLRSLGYTAMGGLTLPDTFDTSKATNMSAMFANTGYEKMTTLSLSNNFDTSKVTDMSYMFANTGYKMMKNLDLKSKFDTSSVKNMEYMFSATGYTLMTSLDLKDKFYTTSAEDMSYMFSGTGAKAMTVLDLGVGFTKIASQNTSMFANCGTSSLVIYAPELIYSSGTSFKLGK